MFQLTFRRALLLAVGALLACTAPAMAQMTLSTGPRLGVNMSSFYGSHVDMRSAQINASTPGNLGTVDLSAMRTSINAGWFVTYAGEQHHGASIELLYSGKGAKDARVNYLAMPILYRYFFHGQPDIRPTLFVGPNFNYLLAASTKTQDGTWVNRKKEFKNVDVGFTVGGGVNFRVRETNWFNVDLRFDGGLIPVVEGSASALPVDYTNVMNRTWSLNLAYGFGVRAGDAAKSTE